MHTKQKSSLVGIGALSAVAVILSGCGGTTFSKNTFANYPNTLPAAYGIEPVVASTNLQAVATLANLETSGLASADSTTPYLTGALDFTIVTNVNGAKIADTIDPNGTHKVPLGFSTGGAFLAGATPAPTAAVTGTSVVFRAALANGIADNTAASINSTGNTLSSTDPEWTLGTLPLTFNIIKTGPLANGTYVTGTGGNAVPFALPFKTSGIHTAIVTVADAAGRVTATTFGMPVVTPANVALFAQGVVADGQTVTDKTPAVTTPITPGDTVTIDGGAGLGTYPAGYSATTADAQGTVVFFIAPGTHTLVDTSITPATATAAAVTTVTIQTIVIAPAAAGTTIIQ